MRLRATSRAGDGHHLALDHDAGDVDGRLPRHRALPDDVDAEGPGDDPEAAAPSLPRRPGPPETPSLPPPPPPPPRIRATGTTSVPSLSYRLAEDLADRGDVAHPIEDVLCLHGLISPRGPGPTSAPGDHPAPIMDLLPAASVQVDQLGAPGRLGGPAPRAPLPGGLPVATCGPGYNPFGAIA